MKVACKMLLVEQQHLVRGLKNQRAAVSLVVHDPQHSPHHPLFRYTAQS